jgi:hypothetical protein
MRSDLEGPEITIADDIQEISVSADQQAFLQGVTAWDDRDGDVTDQVIVESVYGITPDYHATVVYAAFDRAGNVTTAKRQVVLTDYHRPRFLLETALVFPEDAGIDVMDYIGAEDIVDGDVVRWVRATLISNTGSLSDVGTHNVQLHVTNSLGDTSDLVLPVEVYPSGKYNARLELDAYLLYLPVGAAFDAESYLESFTCNGTTHSLDVAEEGMVISVVNTVNLQTPGVYPVTYTVRYEENDTTYTGYSRMFVVVEE